MSMTVGISKLYFFQLYVLPTFELTAVSLRGTLSQLSELNTVPVTEIISYLHSAN